MEQHQSTVNLPKAVGCLVLRVPYNSSFQQAFFEIHSSGNRVFYYFAFKHLEDRLSFGSLNSQVEDELFW